MVEFTIVLKNVTLSPKTRAKAYEDENVAVNK
jgi:hypothetical protein